MIDEAQKAVRRAQINAELTVLRHGRDDNLVLRNRLIDDIERLESASFHLRNYIEYSSTIEINMKNCHENTPENLFKGKRRERLVECLLSTGDNIRTEREAHQRNLGQLDAHTNNSQNRRDDLTRIINNQNSMIGALESELRTLW